MTTLRQLIKQQPHTLTQAERQLAQEALHLIESRKQGEYWRGVADAAGTMGMIGSSTAFVACGGLKRIMAGRQQAGWSA